MGVKRKSPTTPKPDQAGSRAANTAHFSELITAWRARRRLTRNEAAEILCCSARTIENWERQRSAPTGFTLRAIVAAIEGGTI
jgi:DNA-binding transcriptional regulator YiaG